jgi:hypothetical protein
MIAVMDTHTRPDRRTQASACAALAALAECSGAVQDIVSSAAIPLIIQTLQDLSSLQTLCST